VIPERDYVGAGGEETIRNPRRDPGSVRRVLSVDHAEGDVQLVTQSG
jgi:hypothetical protein